MAAEFVALKLAEAVVSQAIQRITDLLFHEANSLRGVREDIENLQNELKWMQSFLEDADRKQQQDKRVRIWVAEVRDVACEIEDAIETYVYKVHFSYIKAFHQRKLRTHINSIRDKLGSISDRAQRYQIEFRSGDQAASSLTRNWRRTYPDEDEDDVITLKSTMADLKDQLMKEEDRLCVVSIVGMGGLGKTTLAKKVYNDVGVRTRFDRHAWVFISQQYVRREVLTEILLQVSFQSNQPEEREKNIKESLGEREKNIKESLGERTTNREFLKRLPEDELVALMNSELKEKRYLIVLDDIWDIKAWNRIESAFPNGRSGSKVLFTTRIEKVASSFESHSYKIRLPLLSPEDSLELLKRIVFPRETFLECDCPSEFETLGKEMLKKCGGLPLAIVVLGGLLRKNNSKEGWEKLSKDVEKPQFMINSLESHQEYRVEDILELSFQDLPYYLKPCFLYMGIFPEDSEIRKSMLVRLWIAEGFVSRLERKANETMEDVAEQCLEELIDRCMVQVDKKNLAGKGAKTCRLHDLMRDFCISKAKKENVFNIIGQDEMNMMETSRSSLTEYSMAHCSRRIVVHVDQGLDDFPWMEKVHPRLSSFLLFGVNTFPTSSSRVRNFRLLKVLSLENCSENILEGIGSLILLRYLRLTPPNQSGELIIPHSIGNLRNLQTLDIQGYFEARLPRSLARLIHLRRLLLPRGYYYYTQRSCGMIRSPLFGMCSLTNIETLKGIKTEDLIVNGKVISLANIRKLGIICIRHKEKDGLVLESLSRCHDLTALNLDARYSTQNISFLPKNLVKLKLGKCPLDKDKFRVLEKLPNLGTLRLRQGRFTSKLVCSVDGFPKLEILILLDLDNLEEWEVEEDAMPNLKRLDIESLIKLRMIPAGLKHITTLRELNIRWMSSKFEKRVRRVNEDGTEGEDYYKVRHIPTITFSNTLRVTY